MSKNLLGSGYRKQTTFFPYGHFVLTCICVFQVKPLAAVSAHAISYGDFIMTCVCDMFQVKQLVAVWARAVSAAAVTTRACSRWATCAQTPTARSTPATAAPRRCRADTSAAAYATRRSVCPVSTAATSRARPR